MVKLQLSQLAKLWLVSASLLVIPSGAASASVIVVNEIMVNEPGGRVSLEWFELYNSGQDSLTLLNDTLSINNQAFSVFGDTKVAPSEYAIVARDLIAFEEHWGDSSGIWGDDTLLESYTILQLNFSLKNAVGTLTVFDDTALASLSWPSAGADGVAWERISVGMDSVAPSIDAFGATPGRVNSVTPLALDWEIIGLVIVPERGMSTRLDVTLRNAGLQALPWACLLLYLNPELFPSAPYGIRGDSLLCEPLPALNPSDSVTISVFVSIAGVYDTVGLTIAYADERPSNNILITSVPGVDFPPLLINEFLPDPRSPLQSEWVELKNISLMAVSIAGWGLGDQLGFGELDTSGAATNVIQPGEYLVLAESPSVFGAFYSLAALPTAVSGWRTLNNDGDIVRLRDALGFTVDSFEYNSVFGDNVSWSRSEDPDTRELWGRSRLSGGTPNDSNQTLLNPNASGLAVTLSPNPFSPDGDGSDETTRIEISAPDGGNMSVTIYDLQGRDIRHLFDGAPFSGSLTWDGTSDTGGRVTIGIYIVYVEIENSASVKTTVVVAR